MNAPARVAIVGAGIGGLAAAHHLKVLSEERSCPLEIVVLEASDRAGGVLGTERYEGALLERGPDTLVTHKPAGIALCRSLGLGDRLVYPPPGGTDILHRGRLVPVPAGFALLAPTRRWPLLASPLLGWRGKLRVLREPSIRRESTGEADESVGSFVRRRFGAELLERIAEPILGGIYMADVEHLSLAATFPRFLALEREHGSVLRGLRARPAATPAGPMAPAVATLDGGLGQIADALIAALPAGCLRLNQRVQGLRHDGQQFALGLAGRQPLGATAVLLAVPGPRAGLLLRDLNPSFAHQLEETSYASCTTVNLAWPRRAVTRPPRSHGFFVPRGAGLPLVAASFLSVKFPERVPESQFVARVFLGGSLHPEVASFSDAELEETAERTLSPLLGTEEPPCWTRIYRHPNAMPQLAVWHLAFASRMRGRLEDHPGLELAGGPLGAYGLPDSIAAGEAAAARLFDWVVANASRA